MLDVLLRPHHMELLSLRYVVGDDALHGFSADVACCQDGRLKSIFHLLQMGIVGLHHVVDERSGHFDGGWFAARRGDRESGRRRSLNGCTVRFGPKSSVSITDTRVSSSIDLGGLGWEKLIQSNLQLGRDGCS